MMTLNWSKYSSRLFYFFLWTIILGLLTSFPAIASANLGYNCVFGQMANTQLSDGRTLEYCETGMEPPVVLKNDFIEATSSQGECYECMCEEDIGMACCQCGRRHRGG